MSNDSEDGRLAIDQAYNIKNVFEAEDTRPSRGVYQHIADVENAAGHKSNEPISGSTRTTPLWRRFMGPGRRAADEDESIYGSESTLDGGHVDSAKPSLQRLEIMQNWAVEAKDGVSNFYLKILNKSGDEDRYTDENVEWIHQTEDVKTHERFQRLFTHYGSSGLAEGISRVAKGLLHRVQNEEERNYLGGYYLNPCAFRYDGEPQGESEYQPCTFLNFPYFALDERKPQMRSRIDEELSAEAHKNYPIRTLLQSRYRLEDTTRRDAQQASTKLTWKQINECVQPKKARSQHQISRRCSSILTIPQLWCLSISGERLMTSASVGGNALYASTILTKPIKEGSILSVVKIIFESSVDKEYVYPINHCDWWFGLLDKYRQILAENLDCKNFKYNLWAKDSTEREHIITDRNWVSLLRSVTLPYAEIRMRRAVEPNQDLPRLDLPEPTSKNKSVEPNPGSTEEPIKVHQFEPSKDDIKQRRLIQGTNDSLADPDDQCRLPFFEWPLRIRARTERESRRLERLDFILKHRLGKISDEYRDSIKSPNDDDIASVQEIKHIQGRSASEYRSDLEDKKKQINSQTKQGEDERLKQIARIGRASEDMMTGFIGNKIIFDDSYINEANEIASHAKTKLAQHHRSGTTEPRMIKKIVSEDPIIRLYRGVFTSIATFIRNSPMDTDDLSVLLNGCKKINFEINTLHLGVFASRAPEKVDDDDGYAGVGTIQKAMITAFKEILFLHFGLWRYLLQRSLLEPGSARSPRLSEFVVGHVERCCTQLQTARDHLIAEAPEIETTSKLGPIVTAESVILLILDRLSKGVYEEGTVDIIDLYEQVVEKVAIEVETNATRDLLIGINRTSEELEIVGGILGQQQAVLETFCLLRKPKTFRTSEAHDRFFKYEEKEIERLLKNIQRKINDCNELKNRISRLAKQTVQLIETQQDANNRAILVFTTITIVFLPLSFMSSLYGMNLRGFGDTTFTANHFWATAIPVTVIIALPCLILALWFQIKSASTKFAILFGGRQIK